MIKVCKFGGTSMAEAKTLAQVKKIVESDPSRRYVVVSAPGKRSKNDIKVTDVLYKCYEEVVNTGSCSENFAIIRERFADIVKDLGLTFDIQKVLNTNVIRYRVATPGTATECE